MGEADTPGGAVGLAGAIPITPGNVGRRGGATTLPPPGPAQASARAADPLSRPYRLPSRGVYYQGICPGHDGMVIISPMRGEQEEIIAGAAGNGQAQVEALRHVTEQCIDTRGIPFPELLLDDWTAAMIHFLALSAGSDVVGLRPVHAACGKSSDQSKALTELACVSLRLAEPGEKPTWPPEGGADAAMDEQIIREIEGGAEDEVPVERVLGPEQAAEPFTTDPLPVSGERVSWRYHRLSDLIKAEEFTARMGDSQTKVGAPLHSYLMAMQIVGINGARPATLQAVRWVKQQPSAVLNAWREEMALRAIGYDVAPRFRCPHCGGSFKVRLPLDGSLFRRRARS